MANSAHTAVDHVYLNQPGNVGKLRSKRTTITFGADYAAAVLPLITAAELGLKDVAAVIPEGGCSGTAVGATVVAAFAADRSNFTLALFNGTTAIGTVDESATTVNLLVLGH